MRNIIDMSVISKEVIFAGNYNNFISIYIIINYIKHIFDKQTIKDIAIEINMSIILFIHMCFFRYIPIFSAVTIPYFISFHAHQFTVSDS